GEHERVQRVGESGAPGRAIGHARPQDDAAEQLGGGWQRASKRPRLASSGLTHSRQEPCMAKWTSRTKARRVRLATAQAWTLAATSASLALGCIAEERNVDPSPSEPGEGDPDSSSNGPE